MKKEGFKLALPKPHNPTYTQVFIVYIIILSTNLEECKRSVKTCMVVFYSFYNPKTLKRPSPLRVKLIHIGVRGRAEATLRPINRLQTREIGKLKNVNAKEHCPQDPIHPTNTKGFIADTQTLCSTHNRRNWTVS